MFVAAPSDFDEQRKGSRWTRGVAHAVDAATCTVSRFAADYAARFAARLRGHTHADLRPCRRA
eukprot:gene25779-34888_t